MRVSKTFVEIFLALFVLAILLNISGLIFDFYSPYFGYVLLGFVFIFLFLIFRKKTGAGFWFELPKYVFLFLLLLVTVSSLKFEFMSSFTSFFKPYQLFLTIATIAIGALVFWMNRDVVGEIEKEKEDEEKAEKKRYEEFDKKFPFFAWFNFEYGVGRAWKEKRYFVSIIRALVSPFVWLARLPYILARWVYGEGAWYWLLLTGIIILGIYLRISILDIHTPFIDEYNHLNAAKRLIQEGFFNYKRDSIVTYFCYLSFKLFGLNILSAKFLLIALSSINIILIYLFAKKINKFIGIISCYLFAISPFAIGMASYIRGYEFSLFFILLFCIFTYVILEKNKALIYKLLSIVTCIILFLVIYYYAPVIFMGTFIIVIPYVFCSCLFNLDYIMKFFLTFGRKSLFFLFTLLIGIVFILASYGLLRKNGIDLLFTQKAIISNSWIFGFLFNPNNLPVHQWFNLGFFIPSVIIITIFLSFVFMLKYKKVKILILSFTMSLLLFLLFFKFGRNDRYVYIFLVQYILIFGVGIYSLIRLSINKIKKTMIHHKIIGLLIILCLMILFNGYNTYNVIHSEERSGFSNLNGVYYSDITPVIEYLKTENLTSNITILTTHPKDFIFLFNYTFINKTDTSSYLDVFPYPDQLNQYDFVYNIYSGQYSKSVLMKIINSNEKGYILMEKWYYNRSDIYIDEFIKSNKDFKISDTDVMFEGTKGSFYVFKWS